MRLVLISDVYPPLRSSGAVQLRDLSVDLARQGHEVTVMVASPELTESWKIEMSQGVRVARLKTPRTKDMGYFRRTIGELLMPFVMLRQLRRSPLWQETWEGVIWYSPTIFLGPVVQALRTRSKCKSYLIIRDIFPEWAADMGLMGRGLPFLFFKGIAKYQYSVADVIGVQTDGNLDYFRTWEARRGGTLEVLQNWLAAAPVTRCSIRVADTNLAGRKILVYAGNMGVAQGMGVLLDLAEELRERPDVGLIFVGRGSDARRLQLEASERRLTNVMFFDEIDPDEIPGLYAQCHVGLLALDLRHKTHNIPGKFLSYMQAGLPVLAVVNAGNDLVKMIESEKVGQVSTDRSAAVLRRKAEVVLEELELDPGSRGRCTALALRRFSAEAAARQIVAALGS